MASIIEVKNPLTGAVEKVDKLDHTAQEIDDAVERALMYGLGTSCVPIGTQNLDTITKNGWYQFGSDNTSAPVYAGELFVMKRASDGYCTQVISYASSYSPQLLVRKQTEGTWSPWEWVNPPMDIGVEYRTTERWNGKPVYVKLVNFGPLPAGGSDYAEIASNIEIAFIDLSKSLIYKTSAGIGGGYNLLPAYSSGISIYASYRRININTNDTGLANYSAHICARYTKTTD